MLSEDDSAGSIRRSGLLMRASSAALSAWTGIISTIEYLVVHSSPGNALSRARIYC